MKIYRSNHFILFALLLLASCKPKLFENDGRTVFKYNESAGITSLDPAFARNQANIWAVNQLFNGLVQLDDNLKVKPCIAKSWEISPDGLSYTFHLRNDVFFHQSEVFAEKKAEKWLPRILCTVSIGYSTKN